VRHGRVQFKRGLIHPLRVYREHQDPQAASSRNSAINQLF
jgi:hypothetical protein